MLFSHFFLIYVRLWFSKIRKKNDSQRINKFTNTYLSNEFWKKNFQKNYERVCERAFITLHYERKQPCNLYFTRENLRNSR